MLPAQVSTSPVFRCSQTVPIINREAESHLLSHLLRPRRHFSFSIRPNRIEDLSPSFLTSTDRSELFVGKSGTVHQTQSSKLKAAAHFGLLGTRSWQVVFTGESRTLARDSFSNWTEILQQFQSPVRLEKQNRKSSRLGRRCWRRMWRIGSSVSSGEDGATTCHQ